jgi:hypothetical protein
MPQRRLHDPQVPGPLPEPRGEGVPQAVDRDRRGVPAPLSKRPEAVLALPGRLVWCWLPALEA